MSPARSARNGAEPSPAAVIDQYIRGYEKLRLARDIAEGTQSHSQVARSLKKQTGVQFTLKDVQEWVDAHEAEIAQAHQFLLGKLMEEVAGLWVSNKANRLSEYQEEIEQIRGFLTELRREGINWSRSHRDMLRTYLELFRQVADELGAYPQRQSAPARNGQTVHYVIETDDTRALQ